MTQPVLAPSFRLREDGVHFDWEHTCKANMDDGHGGVEVIEFREAETLPNGQTAWKVLQTMPLTVTPSIMCTACGTHGFIKDGKWVPVP